MVKVFFSIAKKLYAEHTLSISLLTALAVLLTDYITGQAIQFPIVYIFPIGLAAWREKKILAYLMAILLPFTRVLFHFLWHDTQPISFSIINTMIAIFVLIFYAYLINRTAWQTKSLKKKVTQLEGILPICASCKNIRTENGDYEQIETFITNHSGVLFSHGLCPDCAKKLYPEYFGDNK